MASLRNTCVPLHSSPLPSSFPPFIQRPLPRNTLPPIMSTTTPDTSNPHIRHTNHALRPRSPQIPKGLANCLPSASPRRPSEMTAGKAPAMVQWDPTSPVMLTFAPPPQPIPPSTPSSSPIRRIPTLPCPIHAIILASTRPSITPINSPSVVYIPPSVDSPHMWRRTVLLPMLEAR